MTQRGGDSGIHRNHTARSLASEMGAWPVTCGQTWAPGQRVGCLLGPPTPLPEPHMAASPYSEKGLFFLLPEVPALPQVLSRGVQRESLPSDGCLLLSHAIPAGTANESNGEEGPKPLSVILGMGVHSWGAPPKQH